jgi:hypothetical protein
MFIVKNDGSVGGTAEGSATKSTVQSDLERMAGFAVLSSAVPPTLPTVLHPIKFIWMIYS